MKIVIEGDPIPLKRPRISKHGMYDPQYIAKRNFASIVLEQYKNKPIEIEISLCLTFFIKIPMSWSRKKKERMINTKHIQTPDLDNFIKFCLDSLNGKVWQDDRLIYSIVANKIWAIEPKTEIIIL